MISTLFCAEEKLDVACSRKSQLLVAIIVVILWFAGWDLMKNQGICWFSLGGKSRYPGGWAAVQVGGANVQVKGEISR